jgi:adenylate kinase
MNRAAIILLGPQGSGKGTQGRLMSKKYGFYYFEMGQILRDETKKDTPLAKEIASYVDNGLYLPDSTLIKMVSEHLDDIPKNKSVIFDGVPRKATQADYLIKYLNDQHFTKKLTIYIDIPHSETFARLLKRAEIEGRKDDTKEKIFLRLKQNEKETLPILDDLKKITIFNEIDGNKSIDDVEKEIDKIIDENVL